MTTDPAEPLLSLPGIDPAHLGLDALTALGKRVSRAPIDEFILAAARAPGLNWGDGKDRPITYLEIHDRDWWIDLHRPGGRSHLVGLLAAAALNDALQLDFTLGWTAKMMPAVLTVRSATTDDTGIHMALVRHTDATLPQSLADEIHPLDFADFVHVVAAAPPILQLPTGGTIHFVD